MKRLAYVGAAAVLCSALVALTGPVSQAQESPPLQVEPDEAARLSEVIIECVDDGRVVLTALLVDSSFSLGTTDPFDQRVGMLRSILLALEGFETRAADAGSRIEVTVASFDHEFSERAAWETLDPGSGPGLRAGIDPFAELNVGFETDYVNALQGVTDAFALRADELLEETTLEPCKILIWFTDGELNIRSRLNADDQREYGTSKPWAPDLVLTDAAAVEDAEELAESLICDRAGLVDAMRIGGIRFMSLQLTGLTEDLDPADAAFLDAIAGFRSPYGACGGEPPLTPIDPTTGEDIRLILCQVLEEFHAGGSLIESGCDEVVVSPGTRTPIPFPVDPGLSRVEIAVVGERGALTIDLVDARDERVEFRNDPSSDERATQVSLTHGTAESVWDDDHNAQLVVDFDALDDDGRGEWELGVSIDELPPGDQAAVSIAISGSTNVEPVLTEPADGRIQVNKTVALSATLADPSGNPAAEFFADAILSGRIGEGDRAPTIDPGGQGAASASYDVPDDLTEGVLTVHLEAALVTDSGIELPPIPADYALTVLPPDGYPIVEPVAAMAKERVEGAGTNTARVLVSSPEGNRTCVWLGDLGQVDSVTPVHLGDADYPREQASCIVVEAGASVELDVPLVNDEEARGVASGDLVVWGSPADDNQTPRESLVSFEYGFLKKPDPGRLWLAIAIAVLLMVVVPSLVLYAINYLSARFHAAGDSKSASLPVRVTRDEVLVDGARLAPDHLALDIIAKRIDGERRFELVGASRQPFEFETKVSRRPDRSAYGSVRVPGSADAPIVSSKGSRARGPRVDLVVRNQWVAQFEKPESVEAYTEALSGSGAAADLTVVVDADDDCEAVVDDIARRLPDMATSLEDDPRLVAAPPVTDDSGGADEDGSETDLGEDAGDQTETDLDRSFGGDHDLATDFGEFGGGDQTQPDLGLSFGRDASTDEDDPGELHYESDF